MTSNDRHITRLTEFTTGLTRHVQQCNRTRTQTIDKEEIKHPRSAFLKISTNAHLAHLQSPSSQPATQALQKSQIFRPSGIPIFASVSIYWRFFDFQYSPEFRSFGKIWN